MAKNKNVIDKKADISNIHERLVGFAKGGFKVIYLSNIHSLLNFCFFISEVYPDGPKMEKEEILAKKKGDWLFTFMGVDYKKGL